MLELSPHSPATEYVFSLVDDESQHNSSAATLLAKSALQELNSPTLPKARPPGMGADSIHDVAKRRQTDAKEAAPVRWVNVRCVRVDVRVPSVLTCCEHQACARYTHSGIFGVCGNCV